MREEKAIMKRVSSLILWVALVLIVSATVLSNEKARAEGYITGTVRDAVTNNPISGIYVDAFEVNFGYVSTGCTNSYPLQTNTTDANGQYGFCVWDGIYKVFFRGIANSYVGRWWQGASSFSAATPISVAGSSATNINAYLATSGGAIINGRVTGSNDMGIAGVNVYAYDYNQTTESKHGQASAVTDANGYYTITAPLPPGSYKVKCNDVTLGNNNLPEWWNDKTDFTAADPLVITPGGTNHADCKFSTGGIISGNVTDAGNNPINNAQITVYDSNQKSAYTTPTEASGNYSAKRLRSGNYKVLFKGPSGTSLAYEWYNNQNAFSQGNWVPVTVGSTTPNINAQLLSGGTITGSTNATGVLAKVYDQYQSLVAIDIAAADGTFSVTGLPTGMYKVEFVKYNLGSTWYNGHRTYDSADWVAVAAGNTTPGVNGSLFAALVVSGTVTNEQAGIPKVRVRAYDVATSTSLSPTDMTDSLGHYTLNSLSPGITKIHFDSYGTGYSPEWWDDKKSMAEANPINLAFGAAYPNINAQLDPSQEVYLPLILKN
jgi:protocatechuate 3,4-dioxygenase beta subunit